MLQSTRSMGPGELAALASMRDGLGAFVHAFTGFPLSGTPTPGRLDAAYDAWLDTATRGAPNPDPRTVVDLMGVGVGDWLAERTGMVWAMGRFELPGGAGGEIPILHAGPGADGTAVSPEHRELFCPPFDLAAKRVQNGDRTWIAATAVPVADQLRQMLGSPPGD